MESVVLSTENIINAYQNSVIAQQCTNAQKLAIIKVLSSSSDIILDILIYRNKVKKRSSHKYE